VRALLAARDPSLSATWTRALGERGHEVTRAGAAEALARLADVRPSLLIVERVPGSDDAYALVRRARQAGTRGRLGVILLLHSADAREMSAALEAGADDVLIGPVAADTARAHLAAMEWRLRPPAEPAPTAGAMGMRWEQFGPAPASPPPVALVPSSAAPAPGASRPAQLPDAEVLLAALPEAALVFDDMGLVRAANPAAEHLLAPAGASLRATPLDSLLRGDTAGGALHRRLRERTWEGGVAAERAWARRADGAEFAVELRVARLGGADGSSRWIALLREGDDRDAREAHAREAAKQVAIATLARAVVNDFNNTLAAVGGAVETARRALQAGDQAGVERELAAVRDAARDGARLVRRLRQLAEPPASECRPVDPKVLVQDAATVLRRELPPGVRLEVQLDHADWRVHADPEQVCDLLVALGLNGRDAMPGGGTLRLATSRIGAPQAAGAGGPERPEYVRIDVGDTGRGIAPEHLPRIFDPFFSTKPHGAAGLGLASAYDVLRNHQGGITVDTAPGRGTTVHLFLPRTHAPALALLPADADAPGGGGTILLVDDDPRVRRPLRLALEHCGFRVVEAGDGDEGLDLHAQTPGVRLVVVDHRMPRLSGLEVLAELRRRDPALPVVLVSGHTQAELLGGGAAPRPDAFLRKPFELADLARTVRSLLARAV